MRRGTTPTLIFEVDEDLTPAEVVYVTINQTGKTVIEKEKSECTIRADTLEVSLTQEETILLSDKWDVEIQISARFADDSAIRSNIIRTDVSSILKNEVI